MRTIVTDLRKTPTPRSRRLKVIEVNGHEMLLVDAAAQRKLPVPLIRDRLRKGWSIERALSEKHHLRKRGIRPDAEGASSDDAADHKLRVKCDDKFQQALRAEGYRPYVHTTPGTDFPRMISPPTHQRTRSSWSFIL